MRKKGSQTQTLSQVAADIASTLESLGSAQQALFAARFFKTGKGEYGEGDLFLGVRVPEVRRLLLGYRGEVPELGEYLIESPFHEVRLFALLFWVECYRRAAKQKEVLLRKKSCREIFELYLSAARSGRINSWDLVDVTAEHIVGAWCFEYGSECGDNGNGAKSWQLLSELVYSPSLWLRRIGVLSTFYYIRRGDYEPTLLLCKQLLGDSEDLLHKASGWLLREVGKRDLTQLRCFLDSYRGEMPRTMLRYAIERLDESERQHYLQR